MKLTINRNLLVIVVAFLVEAGTALQWVLDLNVIPHRWAPVVMMAVAVIPKITAIAAHYSNPDGTAATTAWIARFHEIAGTAEAAYEAYRAQAGGKSLASGAPIPAWPALAPQIQEAWQAAAQAAKAKG